MPMNTVVQGLLALLLLSGVALAQADQELQPAEGEIRYLVQTRVWMDGELRGEPSLQVEADKEATVSIANDNDGWRMSVLIEAPGEHENAMHGAIWLKLSIEEQSEGEWTFLADTMLGLPAGQIGNISVVDEGIETATPENARLFVEVMVEPNGQSN